MDATPRINVVFDENKKGKWVIQSRSDQNTSSTAGETTIFRRCLARNIPAPQTSSPQPLRSSKSPPGTSVKKLLLYAVYSAVHFQFMETSEMVKMVWFGRLACKGQLFWLLGQTKNDQPAGLRRSSTRIFADVLRAFQIVCARANQFVSFFPSQNPGLRRLTFVRRCRAFFSKCFLFFWRARRLL